MFTHLDRISENDETAIEPVTHTVHVHVKPLEGARVDVSIPGYPHLCEYPEEELKPRLRRLLQNHVDALLNSEAATFLKQNHARKSAGTAWNVIEVGVKVPRAISEAVS